MIFSIYYWVQFASILLRIFASVFISWYWPMIFHFCDIFVWFWYHDDASFMFTLVHSVFKTTFKYSYQFVALVASDLSSSCNPLDSSVSLDFKVVVFPVNCFLMRPGKVVFFFSSSPAFIFYCQDGNENFQGLHMSD